MRPMLLGALLAVVLVAMIAGVAGFAFIKATGLSARAAPGPVETALARRARAWAIPADYSRRRNPVTSSDESVRNGLEHFADHCATCHANDGSGDTDMGRGLFPPAPDMRQAATQDLTDGEIFYIIEHGVRFTGMPAWGNGTAEGEESSWHLVNFIRRLPALTPQEIEQMEDINPRPPADIRQEIEEQRFLRGDDSQPAPPPTHAH
jgi:mono/diheme cytochrome c family protein